MAALNLGAVREQATRRTSEMKVGNPAYGRTSLDMNLVGSLGEAAVVHWLAGWCSFVKNVADAPGGIPLGQGDILFRFPTPRGFDAQEYVEVKTCRRRDWLSKPDLNLDTTQVDRSWARVFMWCVTADDPLDGGYVTLAGWLSKKDLSRRGRIRGKSIWFNKDLRDPASLQAELLAAPDSLAPF